MFEDKHSSTPNDQAKVFSEPSFSAISYLESALSKDDALRSATSLLSNLEALSRNLTLQVDSLVEDMLRVGPRLTYDMDILRQDSETCAHQIDSARPLITEIKNSGGTAADLQMLQDVRDKMECVLQTLEEANAWIRGPQKIDKEIGFLLEAGDKHRAMERIEHMRNLSGVWKDTSAAASANAAVQRWCTHPLLR